MNLTKIHTNKGGSPTFIPKSQEADNLKGKFYSMLIQLPATLLLCRLAQYHLEFFATQFRGKD
jgi:uncharacterized membrane protein